MEEIREDNILPAPPMTSEMRNVLPHERQSATSVATLISAVAISARQEGQVSFIFLRNYATREVRWGDIDERSW
jgi:hypothetical protein